jgi:hypothetical protein
MEISKLRSITNHYQDVYLVSLQNWSRAAEFTSCDRGGPYIVVQEGYDPSDLTSTMDEFVLGRSGRWLPLGHFFRLPQAQKRAEFVFCTAAEVMKLLESLPHQAAILRPGEAFLETGPEAEPDDLNATVLKAKAEGSKPERPA